MKLFDEFRTEGLVELLETHRHLKHDKERQQATVLIFYDVLYYYKDIHIFLLKLLSWKVNSN